MQVEDCDSMTSNEVLRAETQLKRATLIAKLLQLREKLAKQQHKKTQKEQLFIDRASRFLSIFGNVLTAISASAAAEAENCLTFLETTRDNSENNSDDDICGHQRNLNVKRSRQVLAEARDRHNEEVANFYASPILAPTPISARGSPLAALTLPPSESTLRVVI